MNNFLFLYKETLSIENIIYNKSFVGKNKLGLTLEDITGNKLIRNVIFNIILKNILKKLKY